MNELINFESLKLPNDVLGINLKFKRKKLRCIGCFKNQATLYSNVLVMIDWFRQKTKRHQNVKPFDCEVIFKFSLKDLFLFRLPATR